MQGANKIRVQGAWSTFLRLLFALRTHQHYAEFLREQGFKDFLRIPLYTMRHGIREVLVQQFHVKIGTFHLSYGEYAIFLYIGRPSWVSDLVDTRFRSTT